MNGEDYASHDEFIVACRKPSDSLDPGHNLAKMYLLDQIKDFAHRWSIKTNCSDDSEICGRLRRYDISYRISDILGQEKVGEYLRDFDHNLFFPILSYSALPDSKPYDSITNFIAYLNSKEIEIDEKNNLSIRNNGITKPKGRNCKLESVYYAKKENLVSFLYSCNRILLKPNTPQGDYNTWFLARVPVLVRILFEQRLIEFSLPRFSESTLLEGWSNKEPLRYQLAIDSAKSEFLNLIGYAFKPIDFTLLCYYCEIMLNAEDLGWTIAPLVGAEFDLEQNLIPLKTIFGQFSDSLRREIDRQGIKHPLSEIDLYKVFRALKEQSYTSSQVLMSPFKKRGGGVRFSILYGGASSAYPPLILLGTNREDIAKSLRNAIVESQTAKLEDQYNLKALLKTK